MHTSINTLFENLWKKYLEVTPTALKIHELLGSTQKDDIINDHIALRTFDIDKVSLDKLAKHFTLLGYEEKGQYNFETKHLFAKHFEHKDFTKPKVFISQLEVKKFPLVVQNIIEDVVHQIDSAAVISDNFLYSGVNWQIDYEAYQLLLRHSEYAAWMYAWGYMANHFTVSVNHLKNFETLESVNDKLKNAGFILNSAGGEIKGSPEVLLEQSSTMADKAEVAFGSKVEKIPSCFYEFALRYQMKNGTLYNGFVAASADKIFESTNVK